MLIALAGEETNKLLYAGTEVTAISEATAIPDINFLNFIKILPCMNCFNFIRYNLLLVNTVFQFCVKNILILYKY